MLPLLVKLNCSPIHTIVRPNLLAFEKFLTGIGTPIHRNIASAYADDIISVVKLDLRLYDPKLIIDKIKETYKKFSYVLVLRNHDIKTVYWTKFDNQGNRMVALSSYLFKKHGEGTNNIRLNGHEIVLLGDTLTLLVD